MIARLRAQWRLTNPVTRGALVVAALTSYVLVLVASPAWDAAQQVVVAVVRAVAHLF